MLSYRANDTQGTFFSMCETTSKSWNLIYLKQIAKLIHLLNIKTVELIEAFIQG